MNDLLGDENKLLSYNVGFECPEEDYEEYDLDD